MEHEAGFDLERVGFPSISGCHAILFQTQTGLFGFHNAGGSGNSKFAERAGLFAEYVRSVLPRHLGGIHLYGCTFIGDNRRGYSGTARDTWAQELRQFANAVGFRGPISGYDLAKSVTGDADSAYVEYRKMGTNCMILVQKYVPNATTRAPYYNSRFLKKIVGQNQNTRVTTSVDKNALAMVVPESLRT